MIYYLLDYQADNQQNQKASEYLLQVIPFFFQVNESFLYKSHTHDFIDEKWNERAKELALDKFYSVFDFEPNDIEVEATVFRIDLEDYIHYKNNGLKELSFL